MTQHTPGPWELRHSTRHGYFFIDYPQQEGSATLTKLDCEEADARLIAAAPALLAAAQAAHALLTDPDADEFAANRVEALLAGAITAALEGA